VRNLFAINAALKDIIFTLKEGLRVCASEKERDGKKKREKTNQAKKIRAKKQVSCHLAAVT